jgi:hypothetical protein
MTILRLRLPALLVPLAIQDLDGGLYFFSKRAFNVRAVLSVVPVTTLFFVPYGSHAFMISVEPASHVAQRFQGHRLCVALGFFDPQA